MVYDITCADSFAGAKRWVAQVQAALEPAAVIILVGNKVDLRSAAKVSDDEAKEYAASAGLLFATCSAKTGQGLTQMFTRLAAKLPYHGPPPGTQMVELNQTSSRNTCC